MDISHSRSYFEKLGSSRFEICIYFQVGGITHNSQLQCTATQIGIWSGNKRLVIPWDANESWELFKSVVFLLC